MRPDPNTLVKALDSIYGKALNGVPGFISAEEMADNYRKDTVSLEEQANRLIRYQVAKASASGFLTGLGGVLVLPVTVPLNLSSVLYVQLRMIAAVAHLGDHDIRDDRVKTLCYLCLCGNSANEVLKGAGITIGTKLTEKAIKQLSFETIKKINKAVGFRMLTKFGQTGVINLGKAIPLVGGAVGGTLDGAATHTLGKVAKRAFLPEDEETSFDDYFPGVEATIITESPTIQPYD